MIIDELIRIQRKLEEASTKDLLVCVPFAQSINHLRQVDSMPEEQRPPNIEFSLRILEMGVDAIIAGKPKLAFIFAQLAPLCPDESVWDMFSAHMQAFAGIAADYHKHQMESEKRRIMRNQ